MLKRHQKSVIDVAVTWASDVSARGLELVLNHASTSTLSAWMVHKNNTDTETNANMNYLSNSINFNALCLDGSQEQYKDRYKYIKKYK